MGSFVGIGGNAFSAGDVNESSIACRVGLGCDFADGIQLFFRMNKAFVAAGNVVIDFDAKNTVFLGAINDGGSLAGLESVGADAHKMSPIAVGGSRASLNHCGQK